jgi:quinol---cytochrome c reductase iron-sulfur subunit, bacillus type
MTSPSSKDPARSISRRGFLLRLGALLNVVAAALLAIPLVGYVLSAVRHRKYRAWIALGSLEDFAENQTRIATFDNPFTVPWDGQTAHLPCWVRRLQGEKFQVFAINCTHLGCPVRWFPESGLFMCPCHGGSFYADGSRAAGPPPRGLYEYEYKIENGRLLIRGGRLPTLQESV